MGALSEVSLLFGQRAGDLEKAREIFTAESRAFVTGILAGIQRARSDPWTTARVRIDMPREIETEAKTGYLSSQYASARAQLRFKKGTNFTVIADLRFGIEFDQGGDGFIWQVSLVPGARYQRVDDMLWRQFKTAGVSLPAAQHQDRANIVRFAMRPFGAELTPEAAFNDVKTTFEFVLGADAALAEAVGLEALSEESASE